MTARVKASVAGIVLLLGLIALACGLSGDHPLAEVWKPVRP